MVELLNDGDDGDEERWRLMTKGSCRSVSIPKFLAVLARNIVLVRGTVGGGQKFPSWPGRRFPNVHFCPSTFDRLLT